MKPTLAQINRVYQVAIFISVSIFIFLALLQNDNMPIWIALISTPYLFWRVSRVQRHALEYIESLELKLNSLERPAAAPLS
jgi:hypothetical protein